VEENMGGETLRDCFLDNALNFGEKKAISFLRKGVIETEISYGELDLDSNRVANSFLDWGVKKGDRVVLHLQKSLFFVVASLALQKIGAIAVPLNPGFKKSEMSYLIKDANAKLAVSGPEQELIIREIDPKLPTLVIHTARPYQDLDFSVPRSGLLPIRF
jgi:acyl-coenzyme A synthetase/AMP-(fatty) acid ligase